MIRRQTYLVEFLAVFVLAAILLGAITFLAVAENTNATAEQVTENLSTLLNTVVGAIVALAYAAVKSGQPRKPDEEGDE